MTKIPTHNFTYDYLLDTYKIINVYNGIKSNCKHKEKIFSFEMFYISYVTEILEILKTRKYRHGKYNIFLITFHKT